MEIKRPRDIWELISYIHNNLASYGDNAFYDTMHDAIHELEEQIRKQLG